MAAVRDTPVPRQCGDVVDGPADPNIPWTKGGLGGIVIQRNIVGRESGGLWKEGTVVDGFVKVADFASGLLSHARSSCAPVVMPSQCIARATRRSSASRWGQGENGAGVGAGCGAPACAAGGNHDRGGRRPCGRYTRHRARPRLIQWWNGFAGIRPIGQAPAGGAAP